MLLNTVIPLSLEHLPFFHFPLYSRVIIPLRHSSGMFFLMCTVFSMSVSSCIVQLFASMNSSFGTSSGPNAFLRFSCFVACFTSIVIGFLGPVCWCFNSFVFVCILLVHSLFFLSPLMLGIDFRNILQYMLWFHLVLVHLCHFR